MTQPLQTMPQAMDEALSRRFDEVDNMMKHVYFELNASDQRIKVLESEKMSLVQKLNENNESVASFLKGLLVSIESPTKDLPQIANQARHLLDIMSSNVVSNRSLGFIGKKCDTLPSSSPFLSHESSPKDDSSSLRLSHETSWDASNSLKRRQNDSQLVDFSKEAISSPRLSKRFKSAPVSPSSSFHPGVSKNLQPFQTNVNALPSRTNHYPQLPQQQITAVSVPAKPLSMEVVPVRHSRSLSHLPSPSSITNITYSQSKSKPITTNTIHRYDPLHNSSSSSSSSLSSSSQSSLSSSAAASPRFRNISVPLPPLKTHSLPALPTPSPTPSPPSSATLPPYPSRSNPHIQTTQPLLSPSERSSSQQHQSVSNHFIRNQAAFDNFSKSFSMLTSTIHGSSAVPRGLKLMRSFYHKEIATSVLFNNDERCFFVGSKGCVNIWDMENSDNMLSTINLSALKSWGESHVRSCHTTDDAGLVIAGESSDVIVWDLVNQSMRARLSCESAAIYSLSMAPNGRHLYACCGDGSIRLWDIHQKRLIRTFQKHANRHQAGVTSLEFCSDGKEFVTGGLDNTVRVWDNSYESSLCKYVFYSGVSSLMLLPQQNCFMAGLFDSNIAVQSVSGTPSPTRYLSAHSSCVLSIRNAITQNWFYSAEINGRVNLWTMVSSSSSSKLKESPSVGGGMVTSNAAASVKRGGPSNFVAMTAVNCDDKIICSDASPSRSKILLGTGKRTALLYDVLFD